jgi:succinate-semialdehyde dehydrogenase/glutarate-semialdehyde dehydrogenase
MELEQDYLLCHQAFIGGEWVDAISGEQFSVYNPLNQDCICKVTDVGVAETKQAISAAHQSFSLWRDTSPQDRYQYLMSWAALIQKNLNDLATILTSEQGKPLYESRGEIEYGIKCIKWAAEEAKRVHGYTQQAEKTNQRLFTLRQPIGVVAAITPWNFPATIPMVKLSAALAAGCCVVLKPAEDTPLTTLALAKLAEQATIPAGVINVVTSNNPKAIGEVLTQSSQVRLLSFTGSTDVGKLLMAQSSHTMKKVAMELGGNGPFIVFPDANLDKAITDAVNLKFYNNGQICIGANRFFIHEDILDEFINQFCKRIEKLKLGSGLDDGITQGPLINQEAVDKIDTLVKDAISQGAKLKLGGSISSEGKYFYKPTVLTNLNENMKIFNQEIFGPIACFYAFNDSHKNEGVLKLANKSRHGLCSYVYTEKMSRCFYFSDKLEFGVVGLNTTKVTGTETYFGGFKESGVGREGGIVSCLDEYCELKTVSMEL